MATHSIILAWRIPWAEEPGRLYSPRGLKESDTSEPLSLPLHGMIFKSKLTVIIKFSLNIKKKSLNDPYNHNGVVTHLEPDILKYELKWDLGSITVNKARGGDGILAELFQSINYDAAKVPHSPQNVSKFGKLSSSPRTGKGQFSCQSQRRAMPKNVQTTVQLCSFHMPAK